MNRKELEALQYAQLQNQERLARATQQMQMSNANFMGLPQRILGTNQSWINPSTDVRFGYSVVDDKEDTMVAVINKPKTTPKVQPFKEPDGDTSEYETLAAELGFAPKALEEQKLRKFLHQKNIPVYDPTEVHEYMVKIRPKGKIYVWKRLSGKEEVVPSYTDGQVAGGIYSHLIPIHILRRVKVIRDEFPEAKFYATDYESPTPPDPFIRVLVGGVKVIFGMWDEPGFGDLKTEV